MGAEAMMLWWILDPMLGVILVYFMIIAAMHGWGKKQQRKFASANFIVNIPGLIGPLTEEIKRRGGTIVDTPSLSSQPGSVVIVSGTTWQSQRVYRSILFGKMRLKTMRFVNFRVVGADQKTNRTIAVGKSVVVDPGFPSALVKKIFWRL